MKRHLAEAGVLGFGWLVKEVFPQREQRARSIFIVAV
jgi:hypothetical protein